MTCVLLKSGKSGLPLDAHYVPTRYPNAIPDSIPARVYTENVAKEAVNLAEEVVRFVEEALKLRES